MENETLHLKTPWEKEGTHHLPGREGRVLSQKLRSKHRIFALIPEDR